MSAENNAAASTGVQPSLNMTQTYNKCYSFVFVIGFVCLVLTYHLEKGKTFDLQHIVNRVNGIMMTTQKIYTNTSISHASGDNMWRIPVRDDCPFQIKARKKKHKRKRKRDKGRRKRSISTKLTNRLANIAKTIATVPVGRKIFLDPAGPVTALASFPGAGNTWTRTILEELSGKCCRAIMQTSVTGVGLLVRWVGGRVIFKYTDYSDRVP